MVLLTALLAGVIVVGLQRVETLQAKADSVDVLDALDVAEAATLDRIFEGRLHLRQKVDEFMRERWYPTYLKKFAQISGILGDLRAADGSEQAELLSDYAATAIEQAASKRDGLLADVDEACDAQEEAIRQLYRARREASLAGGGLRQPKEEKLETDLGNASLRVASALTKLEQIGVPRDSIPWLIVSKLR